MEHVNVTEPELADMAATTTAVIRGVVPMAEIADFFDRSFTEIAAVLGERPLGRPVLVGLSRKSTIGAVLGTPGAPVPVGERLFGTLGATAAAVLGGASIVRTHDVRATADFLRVLTATMAERAEADTQR